jgi:hypothetical protein
MAYFFNANLFTNLAMFLSTFGIKSWQRWLAERHAGNGEQCAACVDGDVYQLASSSMWPKAATGQRIFSLEMAAARNGGMAWESKSEQQSYKKTIFQPSDRNRVQNSTVKLVPKMNDYSMTWREGNEIPRPWSFIQVMR